MGKTWSNLSTVTKLSIVLLVIGLIYSLMPQSSPKAAPRTVATTTKKSSSADVVFTEADTKASFAVLNEPLKNSFKPLIVRTQTQGENAAGKENAIPAYMAGGNGNWTYTGTAEVDGVPTALIENSSTGEGVFLKHGERWKDLVILAINPDSIAIRGSESGEELTLKLTTQISEEDLKPANPAPALQGPIGTMTITPNGVPGAPVGVQAPAAARTGIGG